MEEDSARSIAHHGFGTMLRNELGLWQENKLTKWFNNKNIHHADDMSSIILTSYHRKNNGKDIDLDEQVQYYIDYWEKQINK